MISSERQYKRSTQALAEFQTRLDEAIERYKDSPMLLEMQTRQLERHIEELSAEIEEYEAAAGGELKPVLPAYNPRSGRLEIGRALTKMRLSKGLTQEELADLVGTHQPSITRWENPAYEAYRLNELRKVANAMGWDVDVLFVERAAARTPEQGDRSAGESPQTFEESINEMIETSPSLKAWKDALPQEARTELTGQLRGVVTRLTEEILAMTMHQKKEVG